MNFLSLHFLLFLTTLVVLCGVLWRHFDARKNLLLVASWYFYMCWDWRYAGLLLATTLLHYGVALAIAREPRLLQRRLWLALSVAAGIGALGYYKYAGFFLDGATALLRGIGLDVQPPVLEVALPIGISFYTFQALSYVIDVYRGQTPATRQLRDFALFVAFFPTVLAGPITRAGQLLPQFTRQMTVPGTEVESATGLVIRGFIKKVVFADVLAASFVEPAFADPAACSPLFLFLAINAFSFQVYMDVSAYTDIARGAAALCGFRLPQNFDHPYAARTVSNFWQRWHISMSSFFRDYVFISLGGSRHGNVYVNLMVTFLAIGLWHGGGWNFLLYGALHGTAVCLERAWRQRRQAPGDAARPDAGRLRAALQILLVFQFVTFTRILFRAPDLASAGAYLAAMTNWDQTHTPVSAPGLVVLALAALLHWGFPTARDNALERFRRLAAPLQAMALVLIVYVTVAFGANQSPFVYFKF